MAFFARILGALALFAGTAIAQPFPSKPVRVIVPYPAGGIVDTLARVVTEKVSAAWGQPVLVEVRPGADGNIGTEAVAKSAPDGYTWLMTGPAILSNPSIYGNLPWDPLRDFQGVLTGVPQYVGSPAPLLEDGDGNFSNGVIQQSSEAGNHADDGVGDNGRKRKRKKSTA